MPISHSFNKWHPLVPAQYLLMLIFTMFVFCIKRYVNCTRNAQLVKTINCNINTTLREESSQTNVILQYKLLASIVSPVGSVIQQS